jgi:hypothetical protein
MKGWEGENLGWKLGKVRKPPTRPPPEVVGFNGLMLVELKKYQVMETNTP